MAFAYIALSPKWYRTLITIAPAEDNSKSSLINQFSGLAALAGIQTTSGEVVHAIATLESRDLAREFITDLSLTEVLFASKWDDQNGTWKIEDPEDWPNVNDAVEYFHDNVMSVQEEKKTGLIVLQLDWKDPAAGEIWATQLVNRANAKMRQRVIKESEKNLAYLTAELARTNIVALQDAIGQLLEVEIQKLMLARGNDDFAFRVVDSAHTEKDSFWPNNLVIVGLALSSAILFSLAYLLITTALTQSHKRLHEKGSREFGDYGRPHNE